MREINFRDESTFFYAPSYDELVDSFGVTTLIEEHDDDYQGDSYYLLSNGSEFGILVFGWGSCSGCDSLEACDSREEVIALRDDLWNGIVWRTEEDMIEYIKTKDWDLEWYISSYGRSAGNVFVDALFDWFDIERGVDSESDED